MANSRHSESTLHGQENGQTLDTFIQELMLQPDREPVASELCGADV
jgi:hypothetical protein